MKTLKKVNGTDITYLFNEPYEMVYTKLIRIPLGAQMSRLFAPLNSTSNSNTILWDMPDGVTGTYHSISGSDEEGTLLMIWNKYENKVRDILKSKGMPDAKIDDLLHYPDPSYIFYCVNENATEDVPEHKYNFILTGWGCEEGIQHQQGAFEASKKKFEAQMRHQEVMVHFVDSAGQPIANQTFAYTYKDHAAQPINSGANGSYDLGLCLIDAVINFTNTITSQSNSLKVIKGKSDYTLVFSPFVECSIKVINQHNEPQADLPIAINYIEQYWNLTTGADGTVYLSDVRFMENKFLSAKAGGAEGSYEVKANGNDFVLQIQTEEPKQPEPPVVDPPKPEKEPEPPVDQTTKRYIKIVTVRGEIVPLYSLDVQTNETPSSRISDVNGLIDIDDQCKVGDTIVATDPKSGKTETYTISEQTEYVFTLPDDAPLQDVSVRVVNQKGKPVPHFALTIQTGDELIDAITDAYGVYHLGDMRVGDEFMVACTEAKHINRNYTVEAGKDEYLFPIEEEMAPITVTLHDKNKQVIAGAQMTLTNSKGETFSHYTDYSGTITVPYSFFTNNEKIRVHTELTDTKVNDCRFKYEEQYNHYDIFLKDPFPWRMLLRLLELLLLLGLLFVRCNRDITIHVEDCDKQSVPQAQVDMSYTEHQLFKNGKFFYSETHNPSGVTDAEGNITFEKQPCSVFSWIFYTLSKADATATKGGATGTGSFLFHWQFKPYTISLPTDIAFQVVDATNGRPIGGANIQIWSKQLSMNGVSMTSDNNGICTFKCDKCDAKIEKMLATAAGYSGYLNYDLTLQTLNNALIPLELPAQCDTEVLNNKDNYQGNHAIKDFRMGVKGGTFTLEYYTDAADDHIMVYDGTSSDYAEGKANKIFDFDGATNTVVYQDQADITFSTENVCIVVDNGTHWGYYIHCPK